MIRRILFLIFFYFGVIFLCLVLLPGLVLNKKIVIFGGGGFIGSHLVKHLCGESCQIDIVSRASVSPSPLFFC